MTRHLSARRAILTAAVLTALFFPSSLLAHQFLRAAAPADGETVAAVPGEIRLTFSEAVRLDFTEVVVQGRDGLLLLGALQRSAEDGRVLVVPVEGGWHAGEFTLRWTTVGSDGHRTDGTLRFVVEDDAEGLPVPEPATDPEPAVDAEPGEAVPPPHHDPRVFPEAPGFGPQSAAYVAIRALLFVALVAMLGALSLRWVVLPLTAQRSPAAAADLRAGIDQGAAAIGLVAAGALLVAALARLWAQSASLFGLAGALDPGRLGQALTLQPWAVGWWLQAGGSVAAVVGFAAALRGSRRGWVVAIVAALVAAVTPALSGHAVAMTGLAWLAVPADAVHVLAAGGWVGSLFAVVVIGMPAASRLGPDRRGTAAAALVHGFSPTALAFTGVLVTTGVISAWLHLEEVTALWTTSYGRTLLFKVGLFSTVALVGAYNFLRVRPAMGSAEGAARLRRSGMIELMLALAVLIVTAILVAVPPGH